MTNPATAHSLLAPGPGASRLICVASKQFPRYSEADVIELNEGLLLLGVARKNGASDFARGEIITMASSDAGRTWSDEPTLVQSAFDDVGDLMSISFARTTRGLHLFFLGRGPKPTEDTRVYQMLSTDEGKTWNKPQRVSERRGYHIVNNARVIRTASGRLIVPCAYVPGDIHQLYKQQSIHCFLSDDDGQHWTVSNTLAIENEPLMEPGVVQCADGSLYMSIRTQAGVLYEARSRNNGTTWADLGPTRLASPAAPSTVVRLPDRDDLWLFWCDRAKANWKGRSRLVFASSKDHGATWSERRVIEDDPQHSYAYTSFTWVKEHALLTYYDWHDEGQANFDRTNLRARMIPAGWFDGEPTPPVFHKARAPVLVRSEPFDGGIISANSGLLVGESGRDPWQLFYTTGTLDKSGERLAVCRATSSDQGQSWQKSGIVLPLPSIDKSGDESSDESLYHSSTHRVRDHVILYAWRRSERHNGLYRYVSTDGGASFAIDPDRPLMASQNAPPAERDAAGAGRVCNDAFDVLRNPDGAFELFAAGIFDAEDPRMVVKHDNAAGRVRRIVRATSRDGVEWSETSLIIEPEFGAPFLDAYDTQFYGMQVFRHRGFYLGLLHTYFVESQTIQPEWAWSHDGSNWARTRTPAISLGDEGAFDSRMILFGGLTLTDDALIWLYSGYDWRHNAYARGQVQSAIGRATLPREGLEKWLDTLPQP